jgi:competence protein ComEA
VVAAAFMVGIPSAPTAGDAGPADLPAPPPATAAPRAGPGLLADGRVVLNAASETELTKLAGIGPSRARAILALRQRMTRFRAVEDLLRIKGIGRKMLRRLRPNVVLDPPPIDPQATHDPSAVASPEAEVSDRADR